MTSPKILEDNEHYSYDIVQNMTICTYIIRIILEKLWNLAPLAPPLGHILGIETDQIFNILMQPHAHMQDNFAHFGRQLGKF